MEAFLATVLDEVLVAADPRRLESLRGELLQLVGHKMDREGELVNTSLVAKRSSIILVLGKEQTLKECTMISSP